MGPLGMPAAVAKMTGTLRWYLELAEKFGIRKLHIGLGDLSHHAREKYKASGEATATDSHTTTYTVSWSVLQRYRTALRKWRLH